MTNFVAEIIRTSSWKHAEDSNMCHADKCPLLGPGTEAKFLMGRLLNSEEPSISIRPGLQKIEDQLTQLFLDTVARKQNSSALVLGEQQCGKSLVRKTKMFLESFACFAVLRSI